MINIQDILKLGECAVLTSFIKNREKNVNLFYIAEAESGKSEIIFALSHYPQTLYTNDLSTKPFLDEILPQFERDEIGNILIPDFITPLSHRRSAETLIPILNGFLAEGIKDIKFYGLNRVFSKHITGSLITGVTKDIFNSKIKSFRDNGFLSRILPVTYCYSRATQNKIHRFIREGKALEKVKLKKENFDFKLNSFTVVIPDKLTEKVELLAKNIVLLNQAYVFSENFNGNDKQQKIELSKYGFRMHKQLRALLQGIALYNNENLNPEKKVIVTQKDYEDLDHLSGFLNFEFSTI